MTVQTPTRNIHIHFVHSSHNFETRPGAGAVRTGLDLDARVIGRRLTLCELSEVKTGSLGSEVYNVLGQGVSICHPKDTFKKPVGRKLALTAALKASGLDQQERAAVWASYLSQFGIVKA